MVLRHCLLSVHNAGHDLQKRERHTSRHSGSAGKRTLHRGRLVHPRHLPSHVENCVARANQKAHHRAHDRENRVRFGHHVLPENDRLGRTQGQISAARCTAHPAPNRLATSHKQIHEWTEALQLVHTVHTVQALYELVRGRICICDALF